MLEKLLKRKKKESFQELEWFTRAICFSNFDVKDNLIVRIRNNEDNIHYIVLITDNPGALIGKKGEHIKTLSAKIANYFDIILKIQIVTHNDLPAEKNNLIA